MDYSKIFADKSQIEVSVMKVGNKNLTKSLLEQIKTRFPFDNDLNFDGDFIFGYVKLKITGSDNFQEIIIGQKNSELIKFPAVNLYRLSRTDGDSSYDHFRESNRELLDKILCKKTESFEPKVYNRYSAYEIFSKVLDETDLKKFLNAASKAKLFLSEVYKHQIYI